MRIRSTATSPDGKEIHSTVSLASGKALNLVVRRVSHMMYTVSPKDEDMPDEVDDKEREALVYLSKAFIEIMDSEDWIKEES